MFLPLYCGLDLIFFSKICQVLTNDGAVLDTHCKLPYFTVYCTVSSIIVQYSISWVSKQFYYAHFKWILLNPDVILLGAVCWLYSCCWILHHFIWVLYWKNGLFSFLRSWIQRIPMLTYHCTLCVAALTRPHIITSSYLSFIFHLLVTLGYSHTCLFDFQFIIVLLQKIFMSISKKLSVLHSHDEAPVPSHWHAL